MTTTTAAEGLRNCFFLNTNKIQMASSTERFANLGETEIQKLLEDKDAGEQIPCWQWFLS
jgi:hypothetical protein